MRCASTAAIAAGLLGTACASQSRNAPAAAAPSPIISHAPGPIMRLPSLDSGVVDAMDSPFFTMNRSDWPGPNVYWDASGAPGPQYWQQRADYTIAATLDTGAKTLTGTVTVHYTNNSPDTLRSVWMQLDQNLFRRGSAGSFLFPGDSRNSGAGFDGGYVLGTITTDGKAVTPFIDGTTMRLDLLEPLPARGGQLAIVVQYRFVIPEHGSDRMGRDGALYEFAQWYPRMVVYDDVRGWNTDQYLGQGEFYLEYGDIDYSVTVPAGYTVGGSGVLENAAEVLTSAERDRLAQAARDTSIVSIITADEAKSAKGRGVPGTKTWHFRAQNVRDVAWGAAPDFRWDATWTGPLAGRESGALCQSYYEEPKAGREWEHVAENTQWTLRVYSALIGPYPYPQTSSVAGPVSGMEYPMLVMVEYTQRGAPGDVFRTNDHEQGHQWFPMVVGSNERRYGWMDEGLNTYINAFSQERRYGPDPRKWPSGMDNWASFLAIWEQTAAAGIDAPLMTRPDHIDETALANDAYEKPAAVLLALRDHVVARDAFDRAMREYFRRWSYKHPTPGDFFRTIENVTGADLAWMWRGYFYTTARLDIGIDSIEMRGSIGHDTAARATAVVSLRRYSRLVFPVSLRLKLSNGTTQDVHLPVDLWARGTSIDVEVPVAARVVGARLWPNRAAVPDMRPFNDTWGDAPLGDPPGPATDGGLAPPIVPR
jgi:hypothetical protein